MLTSFLKNSHYSRKLYFLALLKVFKVRNCKFYPHVTFQSTHQCALRAKGCLGVATTKSTLMLKKVKRIPEAIVILKAQTALPRSQRPPQKSMLARNYIFWNRLIRDFQDGTGTQVRLDGVLSQCRIGSKSQYIKSTIFDSKSHRLAF